MLCIFICKCSGRAGISRICRISWLVLTMQSQNASSRNSPSTWVMGDKLDKEKGCIIESLKALDFKRNASTDLVRQRAVKRECSHEACS
ncbi:hypothetical protein M405DRAFT_119062 [Rhizopogon salebrosus TDB-379]|nr:hypothetical protein M405DRAFT_119062 [Rhizopogon salebrosus TDB-379]